MAPLTGVPATLALALTVKPPASVPTGRATCATPWALVSAVPVDGTSVVLVSVVMKRTTVLATGALLASRTVATRLPGLDGVSALIGRPLTSFSARIRRGAFGSGRLTL